MRFAGVCLLGAALFLLPGWGVASTSGPDQTVGSSGLAGPPLITLDLSYDTPETAPYGQAVDFFALEVGRLSRGRIQVVGRSSYRGSDAQLLSDARAGLIDMAMIPTAAWDTAGISVFDALQMPFAITQYSFESRILAGPIGRRMATLAGIRARNVKVLGFAEGGFEYLVGTTRPLSSLPNLKRTRLEVEPSKVLEDGLRALGAKPAPVARPGLVDRLSNGFSAGAVIKLGDLATAGLYSLSPYVTLYPPLWPSPAALTINAARWSALSQGDQALLARAAASVSAKSIALESTPNLLVQKLQACGVRFVRLSSGQQRPLLKAAVRTHRLLAADAFTLRQSEELRYLSLALRTSSPQASLAPKSPSPPRCRLGA
jgi:C4-dicarboxylate-binding protein DctP